MSSVSSSSDCEEDYNPTYGVILTLFGCLSYALGNNVQRYALTKKTNEKVFNCNRNFLWFVGIILYFGGNGLYTIAISFAPATVLMSVFSVTIVLNAACARIINGDKISSKITYLGYVLILFGAIAVAVSMNAPVVHYDASELIVLMTTPAALSFWIIGTLAVISGLFFVYKIEKEFPNTSETTNEDDCTAFKITASGREEETERQEEKKEGTELAGEEIENGGVATIVFERKTTGENKGDKRKSINSLPKLNPRMHFCASILYPATLGLIEAFATAILKAYSSLATDSVSKAGCDEDSVVAANTGGNDDDSNNTAIILLAILTPIGITLFVLIMTMLRLTYSRFEITTAFPVEFGLLTFVSLVWAFAIYQDYQYVSDTSTWLWISVGTLSILIGISLCAFGSTKKPQ